MLKKLLCLLLALMMVVSLVACDSDSGKDKDDDDDEEIVDEKDKDEEEETEETTTEPELTLSEKIVGSWVTYIDMSEQMEKTGDVEDFETEVQLPILITFNEDGEVTMEPYGDEAEAAIMQLEADMLEYMLDTFYASMEESGYTREDIDETFQAAYGMTVNEYFQSYIESADLYGSFETSFSGEGEYEVDDEAMILEIDGDEFTVELDGDTLTFVDAENEEDWEAMGFSIPQEFTRVED